MKRQKEKSYELETQLAQIGNRSETETGTVSTPVFFSTAYRHGGLGQSTGYEYTRTGNPTRDVLERTIADLEKGDQGFACSSGMAAIQLVLSLFEQGDEIIVGQDLYGGTYRLFEHLRQCYGIVFHYVDIREPEAFTTALSSHTKAIFIETPTNPLMHQADLAALSAIAQAHKLTFIVDNTLNTPLRQQPIRSGADIVIHSATKYLGGHNDVLAGLIVAKGADLCERLATLHNAIGSTLSSLDAWLLMRGMKTLALRLEKQETNAQRVVAYLKAHEYVDDVFYPEIGGLASFRIKKEEAVGPLLRHLQLITFAESLGGVETFITYPATQTHADIPADIRIKNGVCNRLLRISVGIEQSTDIIDDLDQALTQAIADTQAIANTQAIEDTKVIADSQAINQTQNKMAHSPSVQSDVKASGTASTKGVSIDE
ncbi:methionine biosynthesis PLP-dependent protein [Caldalkalibacillus salinus]|uniref:methionine biosynthesis PLP-dependent protein n=1 Tax=Caldalkalibacillus salinus TaxID=2803787 RepID=UPI0019215D0A|nr:methionine biosynthesis PLP-dependent protein [Caldalkalibacillus salinus]